MTDGTAGRKALGMLTPSSNTVLEPMVADMLSGLPGVSAHFSRFEVLEISQSDAALAQFDMEPMLAASRLLAHAKVEVIAWNGTSAGWLGFDRDEALVKAIEAETGVRAASSMLALNEVFALTGVRRFGLVTPYLDEIQQPMIANYRAAGFDCVAERHLGDRGNYSFATYSEGQVAAMVREVAVAEPDAIAIVCTNLRGARVAAALEAELDIPIYDTVSTAVWSSLRLAGVPPSLVDGWGRLFSV